MTRRSRPDPGEINPELLELGEGLRDVIGSMVRLVRMEGETPRTAQSETLDLLDRSGGLSIARLAEQRGVKHQSMRLVVAQMEVEGLVDRAADPWDGRAQQVRLSVAGSSALKSSRCTRAAVIARMLQALSPRDRKTIDRSVLVLTQLIAAANAAEACGSDVKDA